MESTTDNSSGFPLHALSSREDWTRFLELLQLLERLSEERKSWFQEADTVNPDWRSDEALKNEKLQTAKVIYYAINSSEVWSEEQLEFSLRRYVTLFHPTAVKQALDAGDAEDGFHLEEGLRKEVISKAEGVFKELGESIMKIKELREDELKSEEFAKNAGDPNAADDDESMEDGEGEEEEADQPVQDLTMVTDYHKKHQRQQETLIQQLYQAVIQKSENLKEAQEHVKVRNQLLQQYNEENKLPLALGTFPIDAMCIYWKNYPASKDQLSDLLLASQVSTGFCRSPPIWTNRYLKKTQLAALLKCDPNTGKKLRSDKPDQPEKPKKAKPKYKLYKPPFKIPEAEPPPPAESFSVPPAGEFDLAAYTGPWHPTQSQQEGFRPAEYSMPQPDPNEWHAYTGDNELPTADYSLVPQTYNSIGDFSTPFKTNVVLRSGYISTDNIKPGYTLQGYRIVAYKGSNQIVKGPEGPRETEQYKYVVQIDSNTYQYRSQNECGGGAVWGRLRQADHFSEILEIDGDKDRLYKHEFQEHGFGIEWVALPPHVSTIPSSKPPTVLGVWYRQKEGDQPQRMALMWSTFSKLLGLPLANLFVSRFLEVAYNVPPDSFGMGGMWDALEHVNPQIKRPDGRSKALRQAELLSQGNFATASQSRRLGWHAPSEDYGRSLQSQKAIINLRPGSSWITTRHGDRMDLDSSAAAMAPVAGTTSLARMPQSIYQGPRSASHAAFLNAFPYGYALIQASSTGLHRALQAICQSITAQQPGLRPPTVEDLINSSGWAGNGPISNPVNVPAPQLATIVNRWGALHNLDIQLGVVDDHECHCSSENMGHIILWIHRTDPRLKVTGAPDDWSGLTPVSNPRGSGNSIHTITPSIVVNGPGMGPSDLVSQSNAGRQLLGPNTIRNPAPIASYSPSAGNSMMDLTTLSPGTTNLSGSTVTRGAGLFPHYSNHPSGSGLFGNSSSPASRAPLGTGLFGNSNPSIPAAGSGLFGNSNPSIPAAGTGLFGNSNPSIPAAGSGLFGNSNPSTPAAGSGLFGNSNPSTPAAGSGLFGNSKLLGPPTPNRTGLFDNSKHTGTAAGGDKSMISLFIKNNKQTVDNSAGSSTAAPQSSTEPSTADALISTKNTNQEAKENTGTQPRQEQRHQNIPPSVTVEEEL